MNLCVIPARGGSKRIPRKNIRDFCGKPMIAYAIQVAIDSGLFSVIIVSTDDEEIASISRKYGAQTPFLRTANLSDDHTPTVPVIAHAISFGISQGWQFDDVCCIYPGCPFLEPQDLRSAFQALHASKASYSFPVAEYPSSIQRALKMGKNGALGSFFPEYQLTRTQDLEKSYFDAGQFYWGRKSAWLDGRTIHSDGIGLLLPKWRVVDIDEEQDWRKAEFLFNALEGGKDEQSNI